MYNQENLRLNREELPAMGEKRNGWYWLLWVTIPVAILGVVVGFIALPWLGTPREPWFWVIFGAVIVSGTLTFVGASKV